MSYAIIRTGGKQFPVNEGQTVRVPSIKGKEGDQVDIETLVAGEGGKAKIGGATLKATVVGRGKDDTLFALIEGFVKFEDKGRRGKFISVYAEGATELA